MIASVSIFELCQLQSYIPNLNLFSIVAFSSQPFAVAMHRNFSTPHPIFKLLKEHMKFIIAIDTRGRELLIAPGGAGDASLTTGFGSNGIKELLAKAYKDMTFDDFHYPNHLKKRDMMDLPGFHHRDDAIVSQGQECLANRRGSFVLRLTVGGIWK